MEKPQSLFMPKLNEASEDKVLLNKPPLTFDFKGTSTLDFLSYEAV